MWTWLGYPPLPANVPVPEPTLVKLAVSKADWLHGVETIAHMAQDAGRTEGFAIACAGMLGLLMLAFFVALFLTLFGLAIWFLFFRKRAA